MRIWLLACLLMAGCSSGNSPLEKPGPEPVTAQSLVRPPWQALVRAGPDAGKDLDYETLDGPKPGVPPLAQAPQVIPPPVVQRPEPKKPVDPHATVIKAVAVTGVSGASVQGNAELAAAMAKVLKDAGWPVMRAARKDALSISAKVVIDAAAGGTQPVHVQWIVATPKGRVLGTVAQNNAVPAHSLDASWGASADAVAEAAAEGLFKLIGQYR